MVTRLLQDPTLLQGVEIRRCCNTRIHPDYSQLFSVPPATSNRNHRADGSWDRPWERSWVEEVERGVVPSDSQSRIVLR